MSDFPTNLDENTSILDISQFESADADLIERLAAKGYEVHNGLTETYAKAISEMCLQPSIKEYCPNDYGRRFTNLDATKLWLSKGRAAFLLLKNENEELRLAGYGWAGLENNTHAPKGETTFALRVGEADQGQGLATPFARLILSGTAVIYGAKNFWLETWASDGPAVHIYHKIGFEDIDQNDDVRPIADGRTVADTRLYMSLSNDKL